MKDKYNSYIRHKLSDHDRSKLNEHYLILDQLLFAVDTCVDLLSGHKPKKHLRRIYRSYVLVVELEILCRISHLLDPYCEEVAPENTITKCKKPQPVDVLLLKERERQYKSLKQIYVHLLSITRDKKIRENCRRVITNLQRICWDIAHQMDDIQVKKNNEKMKEMKKEKAAKNEQVKDKVKAKAKTRKRN